MRRSTRLVGPVLIAALAFAGSAPLLAQPFQATFTSYTQCSAVRNSFQGVGGLWGLAGSCNFFPGTLAYFGNSRLVLQSDGNLVIYAIDSGRAAWAANPPSHAGTRMTFQSDGNLVIYAANGTATWATNTWGLPCNGPGYQKWLAFQDDGNLVIYCVPPNGVILALWSTGTWMH